MFLYNCTVALFRYINGTSNVAYFLFDSYYMNSREITDGKPGVLILIKFDRLLQSEKYIEKPCQLSGRVYPVYVYIYMYIYISSTSQLTLMHMILQ